MLNIKGSVSVCVLALLMTFNAAAIDYKTIGKGSVTFLFNQQEIGTIADKKFGPAFFDIWLSPDTSAKKLRRQFTDDALGFKGLFSLLNILHYFFGYICIVLETNKIFLPFTIS